MPDSDNVRYLPARDDVIEAEIVTPAMERERARRAVVRRDIATVGRVTRTVVTHDVTKAAGRNTYYVLCGISVITSEWWSNRTRADRMARACELTGDKEGVVLWDERGETKKQARFERWMRRLELTGRTVKMAGVGVVVWFGCLLVLGIVLWATGAASGPFDLVIGFARFIGWVAWLVSITWVLFPCVTAAVILRLLWRAGRRRDTAPAWCAAEPTVTRDDTITPSRIVLAFRELGIAPLRKAITDMDDGAASMLSPIAIAGCGVEVDVTLPPVGVTTLDVMNRRRRLAENMDRHEHEVHLSVAPSPPRTVRVWAADSGALDEPIGPSPMLRDADSRADYANDRAPLGVSLRGDPVTVSLHQKHLLCAGMSNQGKTKTLRAMALWLALDPNVELWVADLKGYNDETGESDWEMFRDIATRFVAGPTDDDVIEYVSMLEDSADEMKRRIVAGGRHKPLVVIGDEVQVLYMSPARDAAGRHYGGSKSTSRGLTAVRELHNQGRVTNNLLWEGTQDPSNQNYPVLARNGIHLRICTAISEESQARMVLQDKAVNAGARPDLLRLGADKGTVVMAGDGAPLADGQLFANVRVHYINDRDAWTIAERAKQLRGPVTPYHSDVLRDLLQDVHEALGEDDRVRAAHLADRLREAGHRCYRALNGQRLVELLGEVGVVVGPGQGAHFWVAAHAVLRAIDERDSTR